MSDKTQEFITKWQNSGANERANFQLFIPELCDILDLPLPGRPTPPDPEPPSAPGLLPCPSR